MVRRSTWPIVTAIPFLHFFIPVLGLLFIIMVRCVRRRVNNFMGRTGTHGRPIGMLDVPLNASVVTEEISRLVVEATHDDGIVHVTPTTKK